MAMLGSSIGAVRAAAMGRRFSRVPLGSSLGHPEAATNSYFGENDDTDGDEGTDDDWGTADETIVVEDSADADDGVGVGSLPPTQDATPPGKPPEEPKNDPWGDCYTVTHTLHMCETAKALRDSARARKVQARKDQAKYCSGPWTREFVIRCHAADAIVFGLDDEEERWQKAYNCCRTST
ncbi:MAG: hypothetical protein ACI9MC_002180 [Kiritimatiellia bacterium]|jgi:hypothetical protein